MGCTLGASFFLTNFEESQSCVKKSFFKEAALFQCISIGDMTYSMLLVVCAIADLYLALDLLPGLIWTWSLVQLCDIPVLLLAWRPDV